MDQLSEITLEELNVMEKMTMRAFNVCGQNKLHTLAAILDYWKTHKTFTHLDHCGVTIETELVGICNKYSKVTPAVIKQWRLKSKYYKSIDFMDERQRELLSNQFSFLLSTVSPNAQKIITKLVKDKDILEVIELSRNDVSHSIKNAAPAIKREWRIIRQNLLSFADILITYQGREYTLGYLKLIRKVFCPESFNADKLFEGAKVDSGKINLLTYLDAILHSETLFDQREKIFFAYFYKLDGPKEKELAEKLGVSKERIRQLKIFYKNTLVKPFTFLIGININEFQHFVTCGNDQIVVISNDVAEQNNVKDGLRFTKEFYAAILYNFYKDTHELYSECPEQVKGGRKKDLRKLNNCYLIKKELWDGFAFNDFLNSVDKKFWEERVDTERLEWETYLGQFTKEINTAIKSVCETLLENEYGLEVHENILMFSANKRRLLKDCIYEILSEQGIPMDLSSIFKKMREKFPRIETTGISVRTTIRIHKELFISIGRTGNYSLKEWEQTIPGINKKTIRQLAYEYLQSSALPLPKRQLLAYINSIRKTSYQCLMANLRFKGSNFTLFEDNLVGLKDKAYPDTYIPVGQDKKVESEIK